MLENFTKEGTQEITRKKECLFGKRETLEFSPFKKQGNAYFTSTHTYTLYMHAHTRTRGGRWREEGKGRGGGRNPVPYEPFTHDFKQLTLFFGALFGVAFNSLLFINPWNFLKLKGGGEQKVLVPRGIPGSH